MKTIFVSSTFQDMHYERDAIQELIYPQLNQKARQYGQTVAFCDLRWGIDTSFLESETGSQKVLDVCLEEIDRCQPPMVVILGDRYGWIPSGKLVQDVARRYTLELEDLEKSVTALEIEYGALRDSHKLQNTLFYFRHIEGQAPDNYLAEDESHRQRLQQLKDRIVALTGNRVRHYTLTWNGSGFSGMETFCHMVVEDLEQMLLPQWQVYQQMDPFQRQLHSHAVYLQEKAKMFRARGPLVEQLLSDIRGGKTCTVIKGDVGSGKSTLFSHLAQRLQQEGWEVFPLFCSLTSESNTAFSILKLMVQFLETRLDCGHFEDILQVDVAQSTAKDPLEQWHNRLNDLCNHYSAQGHRLVFMLDAVDQLFDDDARDTLVFLPEALSEQIRFVMTCLPELPVTGHPVTELPLICEDDKYQVIQGILSAHNRELPRQVTEAMVALPAADNPLYLSFLVQRLLMMNKADFDSIHQSGDGMDAIARHQLTVIAQCPKSLQDMSAELMSTAAQRINGELIERILSYLALSQHGLRVTDLMGLMEADFNALDFSCFISYMADCFLLRDDGRYDFSHKSIREGLTQRCQNRKALHDDIRGFLRTLDESDEISKRELMYHAIMADNREYFCRYSRYCMNQKDRSYAYHAALNCYITCLHDGGQWLCSVLSEAEQYPKAYLLAQFIAKEFYAVTPGRLQELDMVLQVVQAAKDLSERLYAADQLPASVQAVIDCCQTLVQCHSLKDDRGKAYDAQIRKTVMSVTVDKYLPSPEHRRLALTDCGQAVHRYGLCLIKEKDEHTSIHDLLEFIQTYMTLKQEPPESTDPRLVVSMTAMEHIRCAFEELIEQDGSWENKLALAAHYRLMASITSEKEKAGHYYEQAVLLYRQLAPEKGQEWYHRTLVDVYGEYIKTLGSMYASAQLMQLKETRLELMEKLAQTDKTVDFSKALAVAHRQYADELFHIAAQDCEDEKAHESYRSRISHHYRKAVSLMRTVVEARGTLWDLEELAKYCEDMVMNGFGELGNGEDLQLCLWALDVRKQLYEKLGRIQDQKLIYRLYRMAAFSSTDEEAERQYSALADQMLDIPEVLKMSNAYAEVLEVLRHMDKVYVNQIPKAFVMNLYFGCNFSYDFRMTKSIAEEDLSESALVLLSYMHDKYWKDAEKLPQWDNIGQLLAFLKP